MEPTSSWALLQRDLYGPSKYTGILQASKVIFQEEGLSVWISLCVGVLFPASLNFFSLSILLSNITYLIIAMWVDSEI